MYHTKVFNHSLTTSNKIMKLHSDLSCFFIFLDRTGNLADSYVPICRDKEQQSSVPEQNLQSPWTRLSA